MANQNELATRCADVAALSRKALDWVQDSENAETVGPEHKSLVQLLRRSARRAEKLGRSAQTKMSVSVFGPSQAGKSFLVSVLARPGDGRLVADFPGPGGQLDYISEINPEGEGESTGLVTRFTMTKAAMPDGFPIQLNLLSEADIARTIVNSFYMDGDQSEPAPEAGQINGHLEAFKPRAGAAEVPGMSFEDVLEIQDYVQSTFGRTAYAAALKPFWDDAAALAPMMSIRDRAEFLEILWGGHGALTELYVTMAEGLARIGHPEVVHVPLDALIPRESSIIDVKTLNGLHGGDTSDTLKVRAPSGQVTDLPRAVVCALAAELVFPMLEQPSPLFEETDLLDFPGARNRFEQPLSKTLAEPEKTVSQLLLRGKVAYLFDRYVENQEITSMLLCVPDSNMETLDLPGLVDNWIALTHGNRPEARRDVDCILFFVLTKFDKHLGESAAGGGDSTRFERRMQASLLEKFGRSKDGWVENWTPGHPFRNCYWLRNPNFFVEGLLDYDDQQRETGIRPEKEARLAELRDGCLSAESVQRHFKDPAAAWDAALSLNDGGVSYLTRELTEVCVPDSKLRQLSGQVEKVAGDMAMALGPFHVSDDVEKRIEEKRLAAAEVIDCLEITLQSHRFGALLNALCVDQDAIEDRISRVPSSVRISSAVSAKPAATTGAAPARPGPPPPPPCPRRSRGRPARRSRPVRSGPAPPRYCARSAPGN
uniref:virulence factor SrfC family protein n=1 Tax=Roseovarius halophilus (ex Wu et al. 2025) TaxID=3376060 RepID=UPI00399BE416